MLRFWSLTTFALSALLISAHVAVGAGKSYSYDDNNYNHYSGDHNLYGLALQVESAANLQNLAFNFSQATELRIKYHWNIDLVPQFIGFYGNHTSNATAINQQVNNTVSAAWNDILIGGPHSGIVGAFAGFVFGGYNSQMTKILQSNVQLLADSNALMNLDVSSLLQDALKNCTNYAQDHHNSGFKVSSCPSSVVVYTDPISSAELSIKITVAYVSDAGLQAALWLCLHCGVVLLAALIDPFVQQYHGRSHTTMALHVLGNTVYLFFGGVYLGIGMLATGVLLWCTRVAAAQGVKVIALAPYWFCPFGRRLVATNNDDEYSVAQDGEKWYSTLKGQRVLFMLLGGAYVLSFQALMLLFGASALIGIPLIKRHVQMGKILWTNPFIHTVAYDDGEEGLFLSWRNNNDDKVNTTNGNSAAIRML